MQGPNQRHLFHISPPHPAKALRLPPVTLTLSLMLLALMAAVIQPASSRAGARQDVWRNPVHAGAAVTSLTQLTSSRSDFEATARGLAQVGSGEALRTLIQSLKQAEPLAFRGISIGLLQKASANATPLLIQALADPDAGVRAGAAQILGLRRENQAAAALTQATYDPSPSVRRAAAQSLGQTYAWQALARLMQLQIEEPSWDVRQVAAAAQAQVEKEMAQAIGISVQELVDVSVTGSDRPRLYAATSRNLYTLEGNAWTVEQLPDSTLALATGSDDKVIYLATVHSGLYRSRDGGASWQHVEFGLNTPTQLTVTAIAVDRVDAQRLYVALASPGLQPGLMDTLGISTSADGGATWISLPDSPMHAVTTRLTLFPDASGYLFGLADGTPWRYELPQP